MVVKFKPGVNYVVGDTYIFGGGLSFYRGGYRLIPPSVVYVGDSSRMSILFDLKEKSGKWNRDV